ncbi:MAG: hypothetical protein JWQ72_2196 [Polaromonas sp.]|nr:hypothetical protein [Polaromonas sp.]
MALHSITSPRQRVPAPPTPARTGLKKSVEPAPIACGLLGDIGAELAMPVNVMRDFVRKVRQGQGVSEQQMASLCDAIESANQIARGSQQIARLAEGRLRQSHERVCLDALLGQMLDTLKAQGITVESHIQPVEIIVDAALLCSLVEAAVNWGAAQGNHVDVALSIKAWPEYAVLVIKTATPLAGTAETSQADSLNWHLLSYLAQTMGVRVERELSAEAGSMLLLEFPRTVRRLEGLTTTEVHTGEESTFAGTKSMAGQRLLLIANDLLIRSAVDEAGGLLGLRVDAVPTVERAREYLQLEVPHLIVIDERLHDDAFDLTVDAIKAVHPDIGLVEVAEAPNTFEISSWMDNSMTRLSRDGLKAKLPCVLSLELARAF